VLSHLSFFAFLALSLDVYVYPWDRNEELLLSGLRPAK
jgi:hypothetical protein